MTSNCDRGTCCSGSGSGSSTVRFPPGVTVATLLSFFFPPRRCFCDDMIRRVGYAGSRSVHNEEEKDHELECCASIQSGNRRCLVELQAVRWAFCPGSNKLLEASPLRVAVMYSADRRAHRSMISIGKRRFDDLLVSCVRLGNEIGRSITVMVAL